MPRFTQRSVFLANIIQVMEQFIQLIKYDSGKDLIEMLEELWVVYKIVSARHYIASRGISAGRHMHHGVGEISILENLIKNYPEQAFLKQFRMHRTSFWALIELITPMWPTEPTSKKKPRPIY